jgi:hypothetical protein
MGCCFSSGEPTEVGPAFDPVIGLSSKNKAPTVTVQGSTISGSGSVLAEMPVLQDKAYFETTVVTPGSFAIGFATKDSPLDGVLSQDTCATAWTLTHKLKVMEGVAPGEVVGCALDQGDYPVQIYFYRSGKVVHQISGVRGEVTPVLSVDGGAVVEANFGGAEYANEVPNGFQSIIKSQSLM